MYRSRLGIFRSVDQAANAGVGDGAGAHRARLNRDVDVAIEQTIVADGEPGFAQGNDLGMRRRIIRSDRAIAAAPDDLAVAHDHRSDRHFAEREGTLRLAQRFFHEQLVRGGHALEGNVKKWVVDSG